MYAAGADEKLVTERNGHWGEQGVRTYRPISDEQLGALSNILNQVKRQCSDPLPRQRHDCAGSSDYE